MSQKRTIEIPADTTYKRTKITHRNFNDQELKFSVIREEMIDLDTLMKPVLKQKENI